MALLSFYIVRFNNIKTLFSAIHFDLFIFLKSTSNNNIKTLLFFNYSSKLWIILVAVKSFFMFTLQSCVLFL